MIRGRLVLRPLPCYVTPAGATSSKLRHQTEESITAAFSSKYSGRSGLKQWSRRHTTPKRHYSPLFMQHPGNIQANQKIAESSRKFQKMNNNSTSQRSTCGSSISNTDTELLPLRRQSQKELIEEARAGEIGRARNQDPSPPAHWRGKIGIFVFWWWRL